MSVVPGAGNNLQRYATRLLVNAKDTDLRRLQAILYGAGMSFNTTLTVEERTCHSAPSSPSI